MSQLAPQSIGARLRQAREARGLSQQQAAEHLGFRSHHPVLRMESGQREVSAYELGELARLYRRPLAYFVGLEPAEDAELLRLEGLTDDQLDAVHRLSRRCAELAFLARVLDLAPGAVTSARLDYPAPTARGHAEAEGEHAALAAHRLLALDDAEPIADVRRLLEEQGIGVFGLALPERVRGLAVGATGRGRCIVVGAAGSDGRDALAVAHELGHILLGDAARVCRAGEESDLGEARADRFAEALLLPRSGLESYRANALGVAWPEINPVHVVDLQRHFGVSYAAVLARLHRLGLLTEAQHDLLSRAPAEQLARLTGHGDEPELPRPSVFEGRLRTLAVEAFRRGRISRGRLAELLDLDLDQLAGLLRAIAIAEPTVSYGRGACCCARS